MDNTQATPKATQPIEDPRRLGEALSDISDLDATDVICILYTNSTAATEAVKANLLTAPEHILQNADLHGITEDDVLFDPDLNKQRELALRISSKVKIPTDGFRFGRSRQYCDILLTPNENDILISKVHFKIYVNSQGSLMLEDLSTNGTIVDDEHLRSKPRHVKNGTPKSQATIALKNGSIIRVAGDRNQTWIKFTVRIPNRGDHEDTYEDKLRSYLAARGNVATFASMRESLYGNFWNGGSVYNFTGLLGKGAFATVYRVQTKKEGQVYAAKELDKRRFIKNGVLDLKFDSELNIMKQLKHPNIVNYVDTHNYQHWIYILMEFVPFGELSQELQKQGHLEEPYVQQVARQVLHALDYLHRRNVTHRDIKPDNILVSSKSPLVVKLSDFGLSKCVKDQETFLKTFCGTLLYCAPEVYPDYGAYTQSQAPKRRRIGDHASRTPSPYDQSVDMWSFGAVTFHLLCGKPPIMGRGEGRGAQMLANIMTKDVDFSPLREINVSEEAIEFIAKLLNRNPALRPEEPECLRHAWLRNVPDNCDYSDVEPPPEMLRRDLDVVDEAEEDLVDDELIASLNQLTQPPMSTPETPDRPKKRTRTQGDIQETSGEVGYPELPSLSQSSLPTPMPPPQQRLFGEITQSVLRSSGVFGGELIPAPMGPVPESGAGVNQISVNDFVGSNGHLSTRSADISGQPLQYPQTLGIPHGQAGFAESLLGAEEQIGQLNMASPGAELSDVATPETTNPITPRTRELSPSSGVTQSVDNCSQEPGQPREEPVFSRRLDLDLVSDPIAFAAEVEARNASRAEKLRVKAETFHGHPNAPERAPSIELAATIDAKTGQAVPSLNVPDRFLQIPADAAPTQLSKDRSSSFVKPPRRFGKLSSIPGSFANVSINLESRLTSWGRGRDCTAPYEDKLDVRIPQYALKITFWAPGMEKKVEDGGDWTEVPGVRTLIATSASQCIWVNGVELRKESLNGEAALFGKLYSGDTVTVYDRNGTFLKFRAEITFGDSARPRPESEKDFLVQEERYHHQRVMKERQSMRMSAMELPHQIG